MVKEPLTYMFIDIPKLVVQEVFLLFHIPKRFLVKKYHHCRVSLNYSKSKDCKKHAHQKNPTNMIMN